MEMDNEVSGSGNSLDFIGRVYDPRLGRFKSVDPMTGKFAGVSPFAAFNNNPNYFVDPDGEEPISAAIEMVGAFVMSVGMDFLVALVLEGKNFDEAFDDIRWGAASVDALATGTLSLIGCKGCGSSKKVAEFMNSKLGKVVSNTIINLSVNVTDDVMSGKYDNEKGKFSIKKFGTLDNLVSIFGIAFVEALAEQGFYEVAAKFAKKIGVDPSKLCFVEGTLVLTDSGYIEIQDIQKGDLVWSFSDSTNELSLKEVTETFIRTSDHLRVLVTELDTLFTTNEHPFYIEDEWKNAEEIKEGDALTLYSDRKLFVNATYEIDTTVTVYNFSVDDFHSYYVGESSILVHNADYWKSDIAKQTMKSIKSKITSGLRKVNVSVDNLDEATEILRQYKSELNLRNGTGVGNTDQSVDVVGGNYYHWDLEGGGGHQFPHLQIHLNAGTDNSAVIRIQIENGVNQSDIDFIKNQNIDNNSYNNKSNYQDTREKTSNGG